MQITSTPSEMSALARQFLRDGRRIGLVPTMGSLHAGHLSLVERAAAEADHVVVSIYVNPIQFGQGEDLDRYPRDFERDCELCCEAGVDVVFCPADIDMYVADRSTTVTESVVSGGLCGDARPGHFDGVTTVVAKLFNIVLPDVAVFGQKDLQQLRVLQRMVRDLSFQIRVIESPIVRDPDGLAMSSRNTYLSSQERARALALSQALRRAQVMYDAGVRDAAELVRAVRAAVDASKPDLVDYVEVRDGASLAPTQTVDAGAAVLVAARYGVTRLIDNTLLGNPGDSVLTITCSG